LALALLGVGANKPRKKSRRISCDHWQVGEEERLIIIAYSISRGVPLT